MAAPTDFNLQTLRGRTFEGFVQFNDLTTSTVWYRMKERQTMSFSMVFDRARHYSDDGSLAVDPAGISHSFTMNLKLTSDLFDSVFSSSSSKETLSYWIYQNTINSPISITFVTSFETLSGPSGSSSEDTVNLKFVLDPNTFTPSLGASGGSPEIIVGGIVTSITSAVRDSTSTQT